MLCCWLLKELLSMNEQKFNKACAEYLDIFYSESALDIFVEWPDESMPRDFDPYSDANDRNKVLEKMKIGTHYSDFSGLWFCSWEDKNIGPMETYNYKDMKTAQNKCIEKVLENE